VSDDAAADEIPPPAKKHKKRRGDPSARGGAKSESGPAFARDFPADPELQKLVAAFDEGNYALVREEAPRLAKSTPDDDVRRSARELRRRLDPDPTAVYLLAIASILLVFLACWYWMHPHAEG